MEIKITGTPEEIAKLLQAIGSSKEQEDSDFTLQSNETETEQVSNKSIGNIGHSELII